MGRLNEILAKTRVENKKKAAAEVENNVVEVMDFRPDNISQEVWDLIQENGELATRRLNEILHSPRFPRLRASDQAKLIALAQNRAYGMPHNNNATGSKRSGSVSDVTQAELNDLAARAALPEYRRSGIPREDTIDDAEVVESKPSPKLRRR